MFLADVPVWTCLLRREYLYDLREHFGEFEDALVFGLASVPGRAVGFHVMTNQGVQFERLPLCALVHRVDAPPLPLDYLQLWDCPSDQVVVHAYDYLAGKRCRAVLKDRRFYEGEYRFTIDWTGSTYADDPGEVGHKSGHLIALDNGCYVCQPSNRILWHDPAWVTRALKGRPDYRTNTRTWRVEGVSRWATEDSDAYFYEVQHGGPAAGRGGDGDLSGSDGGRGSP